MLNGCQVDGKTFLNNGFEDGAIVFFGMLFILIIYFVVPRACLMQGLWKANFVVRCQLHLLSFAIYNLLGGFSRDVGSARLVLIWAPWHELVEWVSPLGDCYDVMTRKMSRSSFKNGLSRDQLVPLLQVVPCVGVYHTNAQILPLGSCMVFCAFQA